MPFQIDFGAQSAQITIPKAKQIGRFAGPEGRAIDDVVDAVREALAQPLEAPPLTRALTPDDHVVLVLDAGLPSPAEFIEPLLDALAEAGVSADRAAILLTPTGSPEHLRRLADELKERFPACNVVVHERGEKNNLAYLASTADGRRVYLNRLAADADAVVVVGRTGFDSLVGSQGTASFVYPSLSDDESAVRSRQLAMDCGAAADALRLRQQCDEVGWLMGLFYSMGVALDRHKRVEAVWFGQFQSVQKAADAHARESWTFPAPSESTDLIVASVSPSEEPAEWTAVAEALETANRCAGPASSLLILSDLTDPPGAGCRSLADQENLWDAVERVRRSDAEDSLAASKLARTVGSRKVYLYSRLAPELVESLSMAPVASEKEIANIISRSDACFLLESADRARPRPKSHRPHH